METKRKGSKCYGNSWTKPRMFCALRALLRWRWNHSKSPALSQRLAWRKYWSMSSISLLRGQRGTYVHDPMESHKRSHKANNTIMCTYRVTFSPLFLPPHQHINQTKSMTIVYRWCINERGKEVGGGSCCRRQNGKIKESWRERRHKRGQINRCPWSNGSRDVCGPLHHCRTTSAHWRALAFTFSSALHRCLTSYGKGWAVMRTI